MRWGPDGLVIWPGAAEQEAHVARCPFPLEPAAGSATWPDPPSGFAAGIYWRSPLHAPAPEGVVEVVQCGGGGFGTGDHPTTRMCLERLALLPDGPALDAGCGSGILALAWARLGKGPVLATDPDPEAARQAATSAELSGVTELLAVRAARVGMLDAQEIAGRVLLANLPLAGHREILSRLNDPPPGALLSGLRTGEGLPVAAAYRALGMRVASVTRRGGWECLRLERAR